MISAYLPKTFRVAFGIGFGRVGLLKGKLLSNGCLD